MAMKVVVGVLVCAFITLILSANVYGHGHEHSHDHHGHDHHGHQHHGHQHHGHQHHGHQHGHHHGHHHEDHDHFHEHEEPVFNRYSREMNAHEEPHKHEPNAAKKPAETKTKMPLPTKQPRSTVTIWFEAIMSTILISAAPFFILFFIPLTGNTAEQKPLLKVLLAFASGGLLGDAFLHLIPHAISPHSHLEEHSHSHSHSHDHSHGEKGHDHSHDMVVGFWVLGGMIAFLIVEKFVRYVKGGHGHSHGHSHGTSTETAAKKAEKDSAVANGDKKESKTRKRKTSDGSDNSTEESKEEPQVEAHTEEPQDIKVAGYLNLAADFTHNFTDGLAIGASFLVSRNLGIVTTLTILLHEVPHEIGDFAILVQSGCNKKKAMYLQLSTATGALAGTFCGLLAHNIGTSATLWILPFTAGGFIYIATVSVIPELLEETKIGQSIKEIISLLFGVFMMIVIAQIE